MPLLVVFRIDYFETDGKECDHAYTLLAMVPAMTWIYTRSLSVNSEYEDGEIIDVMMRLPPGDNKILVLGLKPLES